MTDPTMEECINHDRAAVSIIRSAAQGNPITITGNRMVVRSVKGIRRTVRWMTDADAVAIDKSTGITAPIDTVQIWIGHIEDGDWAPDDPTPWEE